MQNVPFLLLAGLMLCTFSASPKKSGLQALDIVLNLGGAMVVSMVFGLDIIGAFMIGAIAYTTSSSISAKMLDEKKAAGQP